MKTVGERIRQAREAKNLSQAALADMVGFAHQSAIGNLESRATGQGGRRITNIADALELPVEWLLKGPDCANAQIPWKAPPGVAAAPRAQEPGDAYGAENEIVREAVELLGRMSNAGQQEALRYLRYLARQHAFPPSAPDERDSIPPRQRAA